MLLLGAHYYLLWRQKVLFIFIGTLLASFYISLVVAGSHEREKRYRGAVIDDFIDHMLETTRDYDYGSYLIILAFGGFQFHS
jgi:hypothetical protein